MDLLEAPASYEGLPLTLSASVGVAIYPQDGTTPEALLHRADERMYEMKRTHKVSAGNAWRVGLRLQTTAETRADPEKREK
jgi:GGDEF domain-containing protein